MGHEPPAEDVAPGPTGRRLAMVLLVVVVIAVALVVAFLLV